MPRGRSREHEAPRPSRTLLRDAVAAARAHRLSGAGARRIDVPLPDYLPDASILACARALRQGMIVM